MFAAWRATLAFRLPYPALRAPWNPCARFLSHFVPPTVPLPENPGFEPYSRILRPDCRDRRSAFRTEFRFLDRLLLLPFLEFRCRDFLFLLTLLDHFGLGRRGSFGGALDGRNNNFLGLRSEERRVGKECRSR